MKYNFSFIQVINWLFVCRQNLLDTLEEHKKGANKEEIIKKLQIQKKKLEMVKDILDRKVKLQGVNKDFLKKFHQIKKDYGLD